MNEPYNPEVLPSVDPLDVITAAQQLVEQRPDAATVVRVIVIAYMEALASLLDDYNLLEVLS